MKSPLKCEGFEMDSHLEDTTAAAGWRNDGHNAGEVQFNASNVVRLSGRVHSDLWHQEKLISLGIKLDVQLVPARTTFFIKTEAADTVDHRVAYKDHIMRARFVIQFIELSHDMVASHKERVMKENMKYIIAHWKVSMKSLNIPSAGTSYTFDNVFKGKLPDRIALAIVADAAATGSYT